MPARRRFRIRLNGAKGVALLGYSIVASIFGVALLSPWALIPPPPPGLIFLDGLVPLQFWGAAWWAAAACLVVGAFRKNQAKSLSLFVGLLFVWAASYGFTAGTATGRMATAYILQSAIFGGLLISCLATARLLVVPKSANVIALQETLRNEMKHQEARGNDNS